VAYAALKFYKNLGFSRVAVAYVNDAYGIYYNTAAVRAGERLGIEVFSAPFNDKAETPASIHDCLKKITDDSNNAVNAFLLIVHGSKTNTVDLDRFFEKATEMGMAGGSNVWMLSDGISAETANAAEQAAAMSGSFRALAMRGSVTAGGDSQVPTRNSERMRRRQQLPSFCARFAHAHSPVDVAV
jgi:hypothetical protein